MRRVCVPRSRQVETPNTRSKPPTWSRTAQWMFDWPNASPNGLMGGEGPIVRSRMPNMQSNSPMRGWKTQCKLKIPNARLRTPNAGSNIAMGCRRLNGAPTIEHEFLARNTRAALTSVPGPPLAPLHAAARLLRRHSRVLYLPCMHISLSGTWAVQSCLGYVKV